MSEITGRIYDIQKFSIHDGPGIRTEVFLMGCPLKCLWCHSPESQSNYPQIGWFAIRCIGVQSCGKCLSVCPAAALKPGRKQYSEVLKRKIELIELDRGKCTSCGACANICPAHALSMIGKEMKLNEVMEEIEKDRIYYRKSGGGVTISGGEAMVQHAFTTAMLKECKERGLHTCLDTSGFAKWDLFAEALPYVDLVLYDLKHMDTEKHYELTGVHNELILENANKMAALDIPLQIRVPIIPGYTDAEENLRKTSSFIKKLGKAVQIVQLLPYHRLGIVKYERLNLEYVLKDLETPGDEHMEHCKNLMESYGLNVRIH